MNQMKQKGIALYYQIEENIRQRIESGEWPKGAKLPSEPELTAQFGVSRATVRQAISNLVSSGLLIRKQGSGTFVAAPSFEGDYLRFYFPEELGERHKLLSISLQPSSGSVAEALEITAGEPVTELYRLRYFVDEKEPAVLEKSYFKANLYEELKDKDLSSKIYRVIEDRLDIKLIKSRNVIEPVLLSRQEAEYLRVAAGSPVLLLSRVCYTYQDQPVILTRSLVRADKCKLLVLN